MLLTGPGSSQWDQTQGIPVNLADANIESCKETLREVCGQRELQTQTSGACSGREVIRSCGSWAHPFGVVVIWDG